MDNNNDNNTNIKIEKNKINFLNNDDVISNIESDVEGNININTSRIKKDRTPSENRDLVDKEYVDQQLLNHLQIDNPHNITKAHIGLSNVENFKTNLIATKPPTSNDNISKGYIVGSRWFDRLQNKEYVCVVSSETSAIWKETTKGEDIKNNLIATNNPQPWDDALLGYKIGSLWINTSTNESFICIDNTVGSAIWKQTSNSPSEINYGRNIGDGEGLYKRKIDSVLEFKTLRNGGNIELSSDPDSVFIKSKLIHSFLLSPVPIDVITTDFKCGIKFPWVVSEFSSFPFGKMIMYVEMVDGGLDARVMGTNNAVLGSINNIITTGFYNFNVAIPISNTLLQIEFKTRNSPTKPPRIVSMVLKYGS